MIKKTKNRKDVVEETEKKMIELFGSKDVYNIYKKELLKKIKQTNGSNYYNVRFFKDKNKIQEEDIFIVNDLYNIVNITDTIKQDYIDNIKFAIKLSQQNNLKEKLY